MKSKAAFASLVLSAVSIQAAENPFADVVRKTDALTPAQEQKALHAPAGFEVQLVASEPDILKPMNMAWDAKGRLWVTVSREYPYPVLPVDKPGRDKIVVLEDFDANGKARKITTFAEGLNIPIGLYPYKNGVIAFTIPKIHFFQDTDGDGKSDKDDVLLTGLGYEKDTHGMTSNFRRGYDGWVYADHGFNNDSLITAKDGSQIKLNSGNCYRFRPDGSHVEQYSWGQVNPFGLMFDHLGDLWSADCHSSAVYQLLRGAYYPSFGKPHDGLGYGPNICEHSHGSTAICGMVFNDNDAWPTEFRHNTYIGNVMTGRVNRDSFGLHGSTRVAKEEPDFVVSDDPWFRPVDLQLGPDGALYLADFYNKIIGHYEVPLEHPGRDRERGRIWRVVYKGAGEVAEKKKTKSKAENISLALPTKMDGLVEELGSANITRRTLAMNELVDRFGKDAIKPSQKALKNKKAPSAQKIQALWALQRLGGVEEKLLEAAAKDSSRDVRVHVMRVISEEVKSESVTSEAMPLSRTKMRISVERTQLSSSQHEVLLAGLKDSDAFVQRAAADAIGRHPAYENIQPLLEQRKLIAKGDAQLLHVARMSLRNQLVASNNFLRLLPMNLSEDQSKMIADVALGVKNTEAGQFLLRHIQTFRESREKTSDYLRHAARYAPEGQMGELARFTRTTFADDPDFQLALFKSVQEGLQQRGVKPTTEVVDWGSELAEKLLVSVDPATIEWSNTPIKGDDKTNPWNFEERPCADGKATKVISSFSPGGEKFTGILRSKVFTLPAKMTFYLCGHDGSPEKPPRKKNFVRLRSEEDKKVLKEVVPPRNDTAQLISWDLAGFEGQKAYLEIVDGNNGGSYAWLAAGRFEPKVVTMPKIISSQVDKRQLSAAEMADTLYLTKLEPKLAALLENEISDLDARAAAAKALVNINGAAHLNAFVHILRNTEESMKIREKCAQALAQIGSTEAKEALLETFTSASASLQTQIALALASNPDGAGALLLAIEHGSISAHVLQENSVKDRLLATKPENVKERLEKLTANLAPISAEKQKLIDTRRGKFKVEDASVEHGVQIFTQTCAVCHQIDGKGAVVGPQLDGVGNRGTDRLFEDILDPNRNVDHAFHYSNVTLKDESVVSGLFRREEGEVLVFVDGSGKEVSIPKSNITERKESQNSLMPDNFGDAIPEQDLNDLVAYLLSKSSKPEAKAR